MAKAKKKKAAVKRKKSKKSKKKAEEVAPEVEAAPVPAAPVVDPRRAESHQARMGQGGPITERPAGAPPPVDVLKEYQTDKWHVFKLKNGGKIKIPRA